MHSDDGETWHFRKFDIGLYFFDTDNYNTPLTQYLFFNTVTDLERQYSKQQVENTRLAKEIQIKIGRPFDNRYMKIVEGKHLLNCPITVEDVKQAIKIYGPDRIAKKGMTVRAKGVVRPVFIPVDLPKLIYPKHKNVCLCVDFFL